MEMEIDFEKMGGLVPAIIQDAVTKNVLMLGFMNKEAYEKTIATKKVTFWSRSRNCLWTKGETSGNYLNLVSIQNDCDKDTLLVKVHPQGPTCHKGTDTCWGEDNTLNPILFLSELQDFINKRHEEMPEGSYTTSLFQKGVNKMAQKVGEEAVETIIEATNGNDEKLVYESSDLLYHLIVLLKNVSIYQADKCILKDVNFHVDEGEFTYLIGKVGSGKSSLLKTLYCELDLVEGETEKAEILGRDLTTIRRKDIPALRKELGIIFQDFQLLHDRSVHKNFEFVLKATGWKDKKARNERIAEVLEEVGMSEKADKMPHELSGGEQQRIAIARALLNNPKLIIADEPTGTLDPETASHIVSLLKDITKQGTTVVMSTHNIPMLDKFPGIVYRCKDGSLHDVTNEYNHIDLTEDGEES